MRHGRCGARPPVHHKGTVDYHLNKGIPQARHPLPGPAPPCPGTTARAQLNPPAVAGPGRRPVARDEAAVSAFRLASADAWSSLLCLWPV